MSVPMNHYKDLIRLGLPIMLGQLGVIVLSFVDTMMIGHCGTAELGAASFVNNMFNLVIVFSTGFSYGLTPVVGGYYGKGDVAAAGGILKTSLCVNGLTGLVLTGLMLALYMCVHLLGQPEELLGLIRPYYLTLLFSLVFILVFNAFKQFFEGVTDTMTVLTEAVRTVALQGPGKNFRYDLREHVTADGLLFEDENIRVSALHNQHLKEDGKGGWHAYSFLIEAEGKKIVFSGDVRYPAELEPLIGNGCDMLIMETGHHKVPDVLEFAVSNKVKNLRFTHHGRQILDSRLEMERLCAQTSSENPICIRVMRDGDVELF